MYFVPFGTLFRRDFFIHIFDVGINFVYGCFVAIWFRCFYHNKKAPNGAVLLWCSEVDELLNSVRDATPDINGRIR